MIKILTKEKTLYKSKDGELVPVEMELVKRVNGELENIKATPIPRNKLRKDIFKDVKDGETDRDTDIRIITEHCYEPKYSEEEIEFIMPGMVTNIAQTILDYSMPDKVDKSKIVKEITVLNPELKALDLRLKTFQELNIVKEYETKVKELKEEIDNLKKSED